MVSTYYVMLKRRWDMSEYWVTVIIVSKDPPVPNQIGVLWCAETRAKGPDEAKAIVFEWLAKGRPKSMDVREYYTDFVGEHGKRSYEDH